MKTVAQRRLNYLVQSIEIARREVKNVFEDDGGFPGGGNSDKKSDNEVAESKQDKKEEDNEVQYFLNKSQFMRQNSQMRRGEITLQMIRINKRLKKKKEVALDVLKMLKDIEKPPQTQTSRRESKQSNKTSNRKDELVE